MNTLKKYLKMYPRFVAMALKAKLVYKADTFFGIIGFLLTNIVTFCTLYITISSVPSFGYWTIDKMIFLYGFCLLPKSIDHVLTDNIWSIGGWMVKNGQIDQALTRPLNPLFYLIATYFQWEGFGELILGIIFITIYAPLQPIVWSFNNIVPLIICAFASIFLFTAIKLIFATISFWTKRSIELMNTIYSFADFAKYPIDIFSRFVRVILVYIIPFSLVIYYPVAYLYTDQSIWGLSLIIIGVVTILCVFAYFFWTVGLKRYESAGN